MFSLSRYDIIAALIGVMISAIILAMIILNNSAFASDDPSAERQPFHINESDVNSIHEFGLVTKRWGICGTTEDMKKYLGAEGYVSIAGAVAPWATYTQRKGTELEDREDFVQIFIKRDRSWYYVQSSSHEDMMCIRHWGRTWFNSDEDGMTEDAPNTPEAPEPKVKPDDTSATNKLDI